MSHTPTELSPGLVVQGIKPPLALKNFKLIAFDMDSTLINIECVDEIADFVGCKAEVAAITEAAMQGVITDFKDSLRQRVALLRGVTMADLERVYSERLRINPGALELVRACQAAGLKTLLVSGGFTFFAHRVREQLGIDFVRANVLEVASLLGIEPDECIAMGDGANDLPMMHASGLSVAYHAKPAVRTQAQVAINQGGLDRLLEVLR